VRVVARGESATREFKKSTAMLNGAAETLCAFLNGGGGTVIVGATPEGRIRGQQVADRIQQAIAAILRKFEPAAPIALQIVDIPDTHLQLIVLEAGSAGDGIPFTFDGRPFERIGTTTALMPQENYQRLLLQRIHSKQRWDNSAADSVAIDDLDHEEILRTARSGIASGRLPATTGIVSALTRRKVRADLAMTGEITIMGKVLPVGGIQQKVRAAFEAQIKEVVLPADNLAEAQLLPSHILEAITLTPVQTVEEVLHHALLD